MTWIMRRRAGNYRRMWNWRMMVWWWRWNDHRCPPRNQTPGIPRRPHAGVRGEFDAGRAPDPRPKRGGGGLRVFRPGLSRQRGRDRERPEGGLERGRAPVESEGTPSQGISVVPPWADLIYF